MIKYLVDNTLFIGAANTSWFAAETDMHWGFQRRAKGFLLIVVRMGFSTLWGTGHADEILQVKTPHLLAVGILIEADTITL